MAKAARRKETPVAKLYRDNPANIVCEAGGKGEHVYTWTGGEIAAINDELVGPVVWMDNSGALPWKLDWIEHDEFNARWYIRRKPIKGDDDEK